MQTLETPSTLKIAGGYKRPRRGVFSLRLTSMIDMFTILLVFLLKSFSAEGQIMSVSQDLRLPESTSRIQPQVMSIVAITRDWILLDGRPLVQVNEVLSREEHLISELHGALVNIRSLSEGMGQMSGQMQGFQGKIAIQGDREMPFDLLKRIMMTCGQVGYNDMHLAVMEKE